MKKKYLDFPPALVIEVLSPATAAKDRGEKMELYESQKVKYYLIVDAHFKKIEVYELQNYKYMPAAINPDSFQFMFDDCTIDIKLLNIWD